jgi:hypothetical protein
LTKFSLTGISAYKNIKLIFFQTGIRILTRLVIITYHFWGTICHLSNGNLSFSTDIKGTE